MTKKNGLSTSKLVIYLQFLDKKEFKQLGLWVRSPIHNSSKNVVNLYDAIKIQRQKNGAVVSSLSAMKHMTLLPRTARQKDISPKHRQELRRAMHLLTEQIQQFLVWQKTQADPIQTKRHLADTLMEKKAYKLLPSVLNKAQKIHQGSPFRDLKYLHHTYSLAELDFYLDILHKNRKATASMKNTVEALRHSCLAQLLRYYCAVINSKKHLKVEDDYPFIETLRQYIENSPDLDVFTIRIYYMMLKVLKDEEPEDYYALKEVLFNHSQAFDTNEFRQLLNFMTNYCHRRIRNNDDQRFTTEKFELYTTGLKQGCWTGGVFFSAHQFLQIVYTALELNKIDWTRQFMTEYGDTLSPHLRHNTLKYCQALSAFQAKQYDVAQNHLLHIETVEDFIFRLQLKILSIKIYYEKNDLTYKNIDRHPINTELEAIKKYVLPSTNKNMAEISRQRYGNFANFFKRILNRKKKLIYGMPVSQSNLEALQTDLSALQPLIERNWLEEKIEDLFNFSLK